MAEPHTIYEFGCTNLDGNLTSFQQHRNKVILVVNTCSKGESCQRKLRNMKLMHEQFLGRPFVILAFPCKQFFSKEHKSREAVRDFYITQEKCPFPVFDRVKVNGKKADPLYKWLKNKKEGSHGKSIEDNFTKFVIDSDGKTVHRYSAKHGWYPMSIDILRMVEATEKKFEIKVAPPVAVPIVPIDGPVTVPPVIEVNPLSPVAKTGATPLGADGRIYENGKTTIVVPPRNEILGSNHFQN